jgi:tRNA pseudouridine55 synthase
MVSAVKKNGKKLYELARKGETVEREPRKITIHRFEATKFHLPKVDFDVECSKGAYIRTLAADIGEKLGCGGVLFSLARTASGEFKLENARSVEDIRDWTQDDLLQALVAF